MNKKTRVVNVRTEGHDIYIGRGSKWGNPYIIGVDGDRIEVIKKYEKYLSSNKELLESLPELKGKRLGCHCDPLICHGDVLKRWVEKLEKHQGEDSDKKK